MSKVEVDQVTQQSGTTLTVGGGACKTAVVDATTVTLGRCGGTVSLASGATQSGFGRTGTVDWDTASIKTTGFTAVSSNGYFCNTTGGTFNATLPASPSAGDIVAFSDYAGTFATNNLVILRNSSKFEGGTADGELSTNRQQATFVYVDGTQGWLPVNENDSSFQQPKFVVATSPSVATVGDYKIHTFTGPGAFCVSCAGNSLGSNTVDYYVIAGGGSGGGDDGGGGGAGGFRESVPSPAAWTGSPLANPGNARPVTATPYTITVGGGGAGSTPGIGNAGSLSTFSDITSSGGGAGLRSDPDSSLGDGGSGGGADASAVCGGASSPVTSPAQGTAGGNSANANSGAGGGGATVVGTPNPGPYQGGAGGAGATSEFNNSPVLKAGGGGGGALTSGGSGGPGGGGGGGDQPQPSNGNGGVGTINSGSGGGGGGTNPGATRDGGAGGSGIVILRYKFQ